MIAKSEVAVSRRELLSSVMTAAVASLFGGQVPAAWADTDELQDTLEAHTENVEAKSGRVTLKIPEIAENGNMVPVSVSVESPMTDEEW